MANRKYSVDHNAFSGDTPAALYWAGFLAADGNIGKRNHTIQVNISVRDVVHLEKLRSFLGAGNPIHLAAVAGNPVARFVCCSEQIQRDLYERFSVSPAKTHTLRWPARLAAEQARYFLRGYFDGDGTSGFYSQSRRLVASLLGTKSFLRDAAKLIAGAIGITSPVVGVGSMFRIGYGSSNAVRAMCYLNCRGVPSLERKMQALYDFLDYYASHSWPKQSVYARALKEMDIAGYGVLLAAIGEQPAGAPTRERNGHSTPPEAASRPSGGEVCIFCRGPFQGGTAAYRPYGEWVDGCADQIACAEQEQKARKAGAFSNPVTEAATRCSTPGCVRSLGHLDECLIGKGKGT